MTSNFILPGISNQRAAPNPHQANQTAATREPTEETKVSFPPKRQSRLVPAPAGIQPT